MLVHATEPFFAQQNGKSTLPSPPSARYRWVGNSFQDAFKQVVAEPEQYLIGRSPAHV